MLSQSAAFLHRRQLQTSLQPVLHLRVLPVQTGNQGGEFSQPILFETPGHVICRS